jgi:hypothetical protein
MQEQELTEKIIGCAMKVLTLDQPVRPPIVLLHAILKGLQSFSPGLRAASYPGGRHINKTTTLKGLNPFRKISLFNPFRVVEFKRRYPG